jgi:hypothetical protein
MMSTTSERQPVTACSPPMSYAFLYTFWRWMTKGERYWLKLQIFFMFGIFWDMYCSFSVYDELFDEWDLFYLSWDLLYHLVSCWVYVRCWIRHDLYLSDLWTWEIYVMFAMCVGYIFFRFLFFASVLPWHVLVYVSYLFLCDLHVMCITVILFTLTCTGCNDLGGAWHSLKMCKLTFIGLIMNSTHIAHIKGELQINH